MAPPTGTNRRRIGPLFLNPALILFVAVVLLAACSGQSCGSSCGCDGFKEKKFPKKHYDKTVPNTGQIRLTDSGIAFIEKQIPNIIKEVLPNGLSFCVPETNQSGAKVCGTGTCNNGNKGCQLTLSIDKASIRPTPPDKLLIDVTVGSLNEVLPFDYDLGFLGTANCKMDLHKKGSGNNTPGEIDATLPIKFTVDMQAPLKDTSIEVEEMKADLSKLGIDIDGRGNFGDTAACEGADTIVKPLIRGRLEKELKKELNKAVQEAVKENLCVKCGKMQASCPAKSSCEKLKDGVKICNWNNKDKCVPTPLGMQGRLLLGSTLGDFMEPENANVDLLARLADMAKVDTGVSLGLRTGFQQDKLRDCAPIDPMARPSFNAIQPSSKILTNKQPNSGDSFMAGIGLHKSGLEHMLWSTWASGGLCMKIGSDFNDLLSTDALSLLIPSLKELVDRTGPVFLKIVPQKAPKVKLGKNKLKKMGDSYKLQDPLATIDWKDLDLHFFAFLNNRYTRLYTTRLDLEVPIGLTTDGMGKLVPVTGDLKNATKNIRIRNNRILADDPEKLKDLVPTLMNAALPQLTGSLSEPIDLPTFMGYKIILKEDDITSVDNNQFIALYASLKYVGSNSPLSAKLQPNVLRSRVDVRPETSTGIRQPVVELDVRADNGTGFPMQSRDIEFSYRVDRGLWKMFTSSRTLEIDNPVLALQGDHEIQVRARYAGVPGTASESTKTTVTIDYEPPTLDFDRKGYEIRLEGDDTVDEPSQMTYRYRIETEDGEEIRGWTKWSDASRIDVDSLGVEEAFVVSAQVKDRAGYIGESSETFEPHPQVVSVSEFDEGGDRPGAVPEESGCSVASNDGRPPLGGLLVGALALVGLALRRRKRSWLYVALIGSALLIVGCNNDISKGGEKSCKPKCEAYEKCDDGSCVAKTCDNSKQCPAETICVDGACQPPDCTKDTDCSCPNGEGGVCTDGRCTCKKFCKDGCGEEEFCCYKKDKCQSYPNPCKGKKCDPGYKSEVTDHGTADNQTCKVSGGKCECVEKEPLDLRWYGEYASTDSNGDVTAVSTYNKFYGDLMVGTLNENLEATWYYPDGVPEDGKVVAGPSGPRGGTKEHGDDVGTHTAVAVDGMGNIHVFYRSEESEGLKYARGTKSSGGYDFETMAVDDEGENGFYTSATVEDGVVHAVYSVNEIEVDIGGQKLTGSQVRHVSFPVSSSFGQLSPKPETVHSAGPQNPCGECSGNKVCFDGNTMCAAPTKDCNGDCGDGEECRNGNCKGIYQEPETPAHRLMTGLYTEIIPVADKFAIVFYDHRKRRIGWLKGTSGNWEKPTYIDPPSGPYAALAADSSGKIHIAYMDPDSKSLKYRAPGSMKDETIVDGTRDLSDEYLVSMIGEDVDLWLDSSGKPRVTYQDATRHMVFRATRMGQNSWKTTAIAKPGPDGSYTGAHGFYQANPEPSDNIVVEHIINQQVEPPEGRLEFKKLQ